MRSSYGPICFMMVFRACMLAGDSIFVDAKDFSEASKL